MFGYVPPLPRAQISAAPLHLGAMAPAWRQLVESTGTAPRRPQRGLVLDLDDTLYSRDRFVRSGFAAVATHVEQTYGIAADLAFGVLTRATLTGARGSEFQVLCGRFGLPAGAASAFVEIFRSHTPALWFSHGAAETLGALRADGWGLVVLTNGLPSVQFRKVAALNLAPLVDDVIYAEEHAPGGKPAEAAFRAALRALDLSPEQCIAVGDDPLRDVRGARPLGIRTIRLARPGVTPRPGDEADIVITTLSDLPAAATLLLTQVTANVA